MAKLTIQGRDIEIAPYKLGALRKAAPFIDRINLASQSVDGVEDSLDITADILAVLAIGTVKVDPAFTAEALEDEFGFADLEALQETFGTLLTESGFVPGEAKAPLALAEPQVEALPTSSADSSTSSSLPA